jgi:hypothetical protein
MVLMADSAQASKLRINLNLLHPKEAPAKLPERFLKWLISYGRFIVIFVEIIVVSAFLTRFKLDADLDTLKGRIKQDLPYVEGLETDEALIKQTQTKLALVDKTYLDADKWQETILEISSQIPRSITFKQLHLDDPDGPVKFRIAGSTTSNSDLGIFLNSLRKVSGFREINLTSISFEQDEIVFTITGSKLKT